MPNPRSLRPNIPFLANYAVGTANKPTIADKVMPVLKVDTDQGIYNVWDYVANMSDQYVDTRAPGAPIGEVTWNKTTAQYIATERALSVFVSDEEADVMGRSAADQAALDLVRDLINLGRERRVKVALTTAGNHGTTKVASGAGGWDDAAADIIGDIRFIERGIRNLSGFSGRRIIIPDDVVPRILKNTALITGGAAVPYFTVDEQVSTALPTRFLGLEVITPLIMNNTANTGQTPSLSNLWDGTDTVEIVYVDDSPGVLKPTWGLQFMVRTFGNAQGEDIGSQRVEYSNQGHAFGDQIWYRRKQGEAVTFKAAGGIITGI